MAVPTLMGSMGFTTKTRRSMEYLLRKASETDRVLVMIYLEGGNDGLNTVIPLDRLSELNYLRPNLFLEDSDMLPLPDSQVALHPALSDFKTLYQKYQLQIVQNVGYPDPNFSHFRSTDIWMSGSDSDEVVSSGWIGRNLEYDFPGYPDEFPNEDMPDPLAVELGYGSSLLFQGVANSLNVTIDSVDSFYEFINNVEQDAPDTPAGDKLKFIRLIARQSEQFGQRILDVAGNVNSHVPYPPDNYLGDQLKIVSKLIAGGSQTPVYLVKLFGFDTHDSQVNDYDHSTGEHANLLKLLNDAVAAFIEDLEYHGVEEKVLGMTFSEFGRTILSNASNGTDHGTAAPMFFFGSAVKGGVLGDNPVLDRFMEYEDNLAHQYDFRQLYASVLEKWFGLDTGIRNDILFKDYVTLDIIANRITSIPDLRSRDELTVYPNPVSETASIRFEGDGHFAEISVMDVQGRILDRIFRGNSVRGHNEVPWNSRNLKPGRYFVVLEAGDQRKVFGIVKY